MATVITLTQTFHVALRCWKKNLQLFHTNGGFWSKNCLHVMLIFLLVYLDKAQWAWYGGMWPWMRTGNVFCGYGSNLNRMFMCQPWFLRGDYRIFQINCWPINCMLPAGPINHCAVWVQRWSASLQEYCWVIMQLDLRALDDFINRCWTHKMFWFIPFAPLQSINGSCFFLLKHVLVVSLGFVQIVRYKDNDQQLKIQTKSNAFRMPGSSMIIQNLERSCYS